MTTLKTVILHGQLGKKFGRVHRFAISSTGEAVRALCANFPEFRSWLMSSSDRGIAYKVFVGKAQQTKEQLRDPVGATETIRFAPVIMGAKSGGVMSFIEGAVLVVAGAFLSETPLGVPMMEMGAAMMLGGVVQMLSPQPKTPRQDTTQNGASYSFAGPVNVTAQGAPVPLGYGRMIVGSVVISAGIVFDNVFHQAVIDSAFDASHMILVS